MLRRTLLVCLSLLFVAPLLRAASWPDRPTLHAVRVATPPVIDGDLSDPAWEGVPEFTDFTQSDPYDGQPATLRTSIRIVYDDHAIYFGAKMEDPERPTALLVRRDTFTQSDFLSINIDPQLDRLSGNAFTVTPANVQIDSVLFNDIGEDGSWDGVWESAARIVEDGWIAEVRVPFSQLRFPDKPVHVWGLNITRRTVRIAEIARIVNTPKTQTGFVANFANIVGIEGIRRGRSLELVPYAVGRTDLRSGSLADNPLVDAREHGVDAGLDLKYALTSSLTLTGTINPDFGQVEVDPAVVNLSEFETFYPEKRPFFTEGLNVFRFGDSPAPGRWGFIFAPSLFYTRRIGRSPQASPVAEMISTPAETTILGAAKVTGRLPGGWTVGVLDALTSSEHARYIAGGDERRQRVEPTTNYLVSRVTREIGARSRLGVMFISVERELEEDLSFLRESAISGGIDGYTHFQDRTWILDGFLVGSRVSGSAEAISLTQTSPARYYQRPDAGHLDLDRSRTSLTGWGGRAMFAKATGVWRPNIQLQAYSPGFETNDAGFMQRTDMISGSAIIHYLNRSTTPRFRNRNAWAGVWENRNFDGDVLDRGFGSSASVTLRNYWTYGTELFIVPAAVSDRLTRGGPLMRTSSGWGTGFFVESDSRKRFFFSTRGEVKSWADHSRQHRIALSLNARPAANLQLGVEPSVSSSLTAAQYVRAFTDAAATATYGRRYVFANLEQRSFELRTRVDWTLTPRLSFQLYLQPFVASGDYEDYRYLAAARTRDLIPADGEAQAHDFNFRSVRGSAVMRWEFRPGSALFVVWNENRAEVVPVGDFRMGRDLRAIPGAPSHDVLLVKVSWWLPM
jgi:hypothetical protein